MNTVGIDVCKGKSTVTIRRPGVVLMPPHNIPPTQSAINTLIEQIKSLDGETKVCMNKKRAQGKPYYIYMTAGAIKFLRIYYGRVKEYLFTLPENEES